MTAPGRIRSATARILRLLGWFVRDPDGRDPPRSRLAPALERIAASKDGDALILDDAGPVVPSRSGDRRPGILAGCATGILAAAVWGAVGAAGPAVAAALAGSALLSLSVADGRDRPWLRVAAIVLGCASVPLLVSLPPGMPTAGAAASAVLSAAWAVGHRLDREKARTKEDRLTVPPLLLYADRIEAVEKSGGSAPRWTLRLHPAMRIVPAEGNEAPGVVIEDVLGRTVVRGRRFVDAEGRPLDLDLLEEILGRAAVL